VKAEQSPAFTHELGRLAAVLDRADAPMLRVGAAHEFACR